MRKKLLWLIIMIGLFTINGFTTAQAQKKIVITTLMKSRFLEAAITAFQKRHPEITIQVNAFGNGADIDIERYVKTTVTALMSGKAADIISLDYLPYQKLAERNVLVNLDTLSAQDQRFDSHNYHTNIFKACHYKNNLYALPVCFCFDALLANQEILGKAKLTMNDSNWTWEDFAKVAAKVTTDRNGDGNPEQFALPTMNRLYLFDFMFQYQFSRYVDPTHKVAHFNSPQFKGLLNLCKSFTDRRLIAAETDSNPSSALQTLSTTIAFIPIQMNNYGNYTFYFTIGESAICIGGPNSKSVFNDKFQIIKLPGNGKNSSFTIPLGMFLAINRKSKNQAEAWEFLKYLLSTEAQVNRSLPGMAVNKEAQAQKSVIERDWQMANGIKNPLGQAEVDRVNRLIGSLSYFNNIDLQVNQFLHDEIVKFWSGQKTVDEVTKIIQGKVETYLRE